jgi:hypothetical protein
MFNKKCVILSKKEKRKKKKEKKKKMLYSKIIVGVCCVLVVGWIWHVRWQNFNNGIYMGEKVDFSLFPSEELAIYDPVYDFEICVGIPAKADKLDLRILHRKTRSNLALSAQTKWNVRFFVGRNDDTLAENKIYGDLIFVDPDDESSQTPVEKLVNAATTFKVLEIMRWAVEKNCTFIIRQDLDAYANYLEFERVLAKMPRTRLLMGRFRYNQNVRSLVQPYLRANFFLPYPLGMGYVVTRDIARMLARTENLLTNEPEDAMMGLWLAGRQLLKVDDIRFQNRLCNRGPERWTEQPCLKTDLLIHYIRPHDWLTIDRNGTIQCKC